MRFIEGKGAKITHEGFAGAIKADGRSAFGNGVTGYYSSSKIMAILKERYATHYAEKGIRAVLSKITVNDGLPNFRNFLWVELVDEAASTYEPSQAVSSS